MSEGPSERRRRYKPGLNLAPHKVAQLRSALRWTLRRAPWLVIGSLAGAFFVRTGPGQTTQDALLELAKCVGGGLFAGLLVDRLVRRQSSR